jgi:PAS domain S-box-containing protein
MKKMGKPLRVLMVEDSEDDALLVFRALKNGGYDPEYERVQSAETMRAALREMTWDVILCDYLLPQFNGLAAIALLKESGIDIPLIIVSGAIGEETAVDCMRFGARDYVMKDNLLRLVPAIERELREAESRVNLKRMGEALRESDANYRQLFDDSPTAIYQIDFRTGKFLKANDVVCEYLGCRQEDITSLTPYDFMTQESQKLFLERLNKMALCDKVPEDPEYEMVDKNGKRRWLQLSSKNIYDSEGLAGADVVAHDITERKRAEEALRESEEKYRELIRYAPAGIYEVDYETNRFTSVNDIICEYTGYTKDELLTMNLFNLLTKESRKLMLARLEKLMAGEKVETMVEYGIRTKNGNELWTLINARYIYTAGKLKGATGVIYNITERRRAEEELRESKELFSLFMSHSPVYAYIKEVTSAESRVLQASDNYEQMIGIPGPKMIGRTMAELFPPEFAAKITADDWAVVSSGNVLHQDEDLNGRSYATIKFPIIQRGKNLLAGYTIDITDRKRAETQLERSMESLKNAVSATIQVMVSAVETRDPYTAGHQIRSADLARTIAGEMGLPQEKIDGIRMAGSIHDIGKLSIPSEILSKPTKLSEIEFSLIKEHAQQGFEILKGVESPWPLAEMVYQHHERMDGSGYPRQLKGDGILMEARILAVADVVEAIASHRPYRAALGVDAALEEISKNSGILYDPEVTDACLRLFREKGYRLN